MGWAVPCLVVVVTIVAASGCGRTDIGTDMASPLHRQIDQPLGLAVPGWSNPIGGVDVKSVAIARRHVSYKITIPSGLGTGRLLMTPDRRPALTVVVFQYRTRPFGPVNLYEEAPHETQAQFVAGARQLLSWNGRPGTLGSARLATVNGTTALITSAPSGRSEIQWVDAGVRYTINGPALTLQECVSLANTVHL